MAVHSFVMLGQSNMAGRGDFNEVPEIKNPRCKMLRNGRWQFMSEPINPDRGIFNLEFHSGVSLAASFAEEYVNHIDNPDIHCGLVPCADGGTKLDDWAPGGVLYDNAVFQVRQAQRTSDIHGILWHQGESDAVHLENISQYRHKLEDFFNHFLQDTHLEGIPIVMGELGHYLATAPTRWGDRIQHTYQDVNTIIHDYVDEHDNVALATAENLTCKQDGIHFNSASLRIFGRRYFNAYSTLIH